MEKTFEEKIESKVKELPNITKEALATFDWKGSLTNVAHKHKLYIDQIESLYEVSMNIMLGEIEPDLIVNTIKNELIIEKPEAEAIVTDLEAFVFQPIHNYILKNGAEDDDSESEGALLSSLENPPTSRPVSFVEAKMQAPHSLKEKTISDDDVPLPPETSGVDPYREEF